MFKEQARLIIEDYRGDWILPEQYGWHRSARKRFETISIVNWACDELIAMVRQCPDCIDISNVIAEFRRIMAKCERAREETAYIFAIALDVADDLEDYFGANQTK